MPGGLMRWNRSNAGGAEAVDLLHAVIVTPLRAFCKLPAEQSNAA
jgi:hypothetical protein